MERQNLRYPMCLLASLVLLAHCAARASGQASGFDSSVQRPHRTANLFLENQQATALLTEFLQDEDLEAEAVDCLRRGERGASAGIREDAKRFPVRKGLERHPSASEPTAVSSPVPILEETETGPQSLKQVLSPCFFGTDSPKEGAAHRSLQSTGRGNTDATAQGGEAQTAQAPPTSFPTPLSSFMAALYARLYPAPSTEDGSEKAEIVEQSQATAASQTPKRASKRARKGTVERQTELLMRLRAGEVFDIGDDGEPIAARGAGAYEVLPLEGSPGLGGAVFRQRAAALSTLPWCARGFVPYNTSGAFGRFDMFGCLQISGIHTAQTHYKTIIVIDRTDANNTKMKLNGTGRNAYGEELTFGPDPQAVYPFSERALDVKSNVFCSAGQFLADGTMLSIGGSSDASNADPLLNGSFAIRAFHPCPPGGTCDFQLSGDMTTKRWYPTAQILPDGRVFIVGGANVYGNIAINTYEKNNPTVEYWPRKPGEAPNYPIQFLTDTLPFNLYPFVHILPSGKIFIFAADRYTLYSTATNAEIPGHYPQLNATSDVTNIPIFRSYPVSGSSALFPLSSANNYTAEIMICGGNSAAAVLVPGDPTRTVRNGRTPADYLCWRITPEARNPSWTREVMCDWPLCTTKMRRVMPDMVILVDGSLLIVNGAQQGFMGLKQTYANLPQLQPLLYFTNNHSWAPMANLPPSLVPRGYHSAALLLHDATVLISGSNPNPNLYMGGGFPTEFRVEKFVPHYLMRGLARPVITRSPKSLTLGSMFAIFFNATQASSALPRNRFSFALSYPGFSTHNQRHGARHVILDSLAIMRTRGSTFVAVLKAPPNANIAMPTWYWLYVLDNGVPSTEAAAVIVTLPVRSTSRSN